MTLGQSLLWTAGQPKQLSVAARKLLDDPRSSSPSLWASNLACCAEVCSTTTTLPSRDSY